MERVRDGKTTIKIKFLFLMGVGVTGAERKIVQKRCFQSVPKEQRRRHAENPLSKALILDSPFCSLPFTRAFLNLWFGEPVVCTLDSRGFRHFRGFRDFRESGTQHLVCSCLSCLRRFRRFRDFRRVRERRPAPKP